MNVKQANLRYKEALVPLNISGVKYIALHHPEAITATPEQIHQWHLANGWSGAGYNEYIRKDGTVYIMRGDHIGAQAEKFNSISYGICCEGNYDIEKEMPKAQFDALVERLKYHKSRFPGAEIVGHKDLNPTACPGKYFPLEVAKNAMREHWGQKYYDYLKSKGLDIKEAKFDNTVTRAEVFKLMALVMGYKE